MNYGMHYNVINMIFAAILAGGVGNRLNLGIPKQFYEINNKPLLVYCIEQFLKVSVIDKIIISSPPTHLKQTKSVITKYFPNETRLAIITGGKTRNGTILNSINYAINQDAPKDSIMITHDGARIFVSPDLIKESIRYAKIYDASSPIIPATDVIFESKKEGKLHNIPKRKFLFHAQTPQSFKLYEYLEIYSTLSEEEIELLDEAMMLFYLRNKSIHLFKGDPMNFKITQPFDIELAKTMLNNEK